MIDGSSSSVSPAFSERARADVDGLWGLLLEHPFVTEMANGILPPAKYEGYIEQNLLYLPRYARAIAFGAAKSTTDSELYEFSAALANIVETEIPQNLELWKRVRALTQTARPAATELADGTRAYADFLLGTAADGTALDIRAAILPCAWSYGEIARHHVTQGVSEHPVYSDWFRFFATDEYADLVDGQRRQVDAAAEHATPSDQERLHEIFQTATALEKGFWDMAYREPALDEDLR